MAELLESLENGGGKLSATSSWRSRSRLERKHHPQPGVPWKLGPEEVLFAALSARTVELARLRAGPGGDYRGALMAVELKIAVELGKLLEKTSDPIFEGLSKVAIEEAGLVCGVCHEEMEVGSHGRMMECKNTFRLHCIVKWLERKMTCPLCRYNMPIIID
nr:TPA_asm: hypothetical protein HUJ06_000956 [Nelumbo nucifera]